VAAIAVLLDADRQLLREEPERLRRPVAEGEVRVPIRRDVALEHGVEVVELVALGAEPVVAVVRQHGVQQHQPANQPALRIPAMVITVAGLQCRLSGSPMAS